jgi:Cys-tRNA(Pro)/Cys-tRNA(Cys) deacylase
VTPAIEVLRRAGIEHRVIELDNVSTEPSYGEAAAKALGVAAELVFKTLVARLDAKELVVALVPVLAELDLKALAALAGARRAEMAVPRDAERSSGYVVGGISPLGQRKALRTFVDESLMSHATVYVSAGRRGLELALAARDLIKMCDGCAGTIARESR